MRAGQAAAVLLLLLSAEAATALPTPGDESPDLGEAIRHYHYYDQPQHHRSLALPELREGRNDSDSTPHAPCSTTCDGPFSAVVVQGNCVGSTWTGTLLENSECIQSVISPSSRWSDGAFRGTAEELLDFVEPEPRVNKTEAFTKGAMIYHELVPSLIQVTTRRTHLTACMHTASVQH